MLRWVYGFMPKGILTRLTVATHAYIAEAGRTVWRSGVVLKHDGAQCEAVENYHQRQLTLRARGPGRKVLLGIVLHELERIHRSFPNLESQATVPCNCFDCAGRSEPHAFPLEVLQRAARARQPIQCQRSWQMVNAAELIDAVFDREQPGHGLRQHAASPEVFISYAWRTDTEIVDRVTETLRERGLNVVRDKDALRYKDSIREFMERAGRTKAAVLVLSEAYLRSHNCMFELLEIHKSRELRARSFPIVLDADAIHDPVRILGHIKFWEEKIRELDEAMKGVEGSNLEGIRERLDLYREIRATVARLADVLGDMNHLTPADHADRGFAELAETIGRQLG